MRESSLFLEGQGVTQRTMGYGSPWYPATSLGLISRSIPCLFAFLAKFVNNQKVVIFYKTVLKDRVHIIIDYILLIIRFRPIHISIV